jgi:hypothetical protein
MCYLVILDVLGLFLNDYIGYIFIWHVDYLATNWLYGLWAIWLFSMWLMGLNLKVYSLRF